MNIFNNYSNQDKYLILVRKLKEAFLSFHSDLIEVFPKGNNLFLQYIVVNQLPDTCLYKILQKNIDIELIEIEDEYYLKNNLILLKDYEKYLNEIDSVKKYFEFSQILNSDNNNILFEENKEMIWKWLKIFTIMIKNIDIVSK
jgi:hypothetical protein